MKISVLCTSAEHPVNTWLRQWTESRHQAHDIVICRDKAELPGGDILFLVSCSQLIQETTRRLYRHALVLHASDLPKGRGWSPYIWELLEGAEGITVSLLDAEDKVDSGAVWAKRHLSIPCHALNDEIHAALFEAEIDLMDDAIALIADGCSPTPQDHEIEPSYYRKRTPADSEIDPSLPLQTLFNQLRLMDPERYPAFFHLHGHKYTIVLKKVSSDDKHHD
ncbi:formyltransferase family protein [Pistricoccus aurantiacus]|uniref:formyltransferase family protein n=1 Tax=Pistricoccus aurantiacus TaxID=1883414 RepID=UPI0036442D44